MNKRYVTWYIGEYNNMKLIGHKNQFSICKNIKNPFINTINGQGSDIGGNNEGIHYKNFYATYLLGPCLIMNPYFTKYILKQMGIDDTLIYEQDLLNAYKKRLDHFIDPKARFAMRDHG